MSSNYTMSVRAAKRPTDAALLPSILSVATCLACAAAGDKGLPVHAPECARSPIIECAAIEYPSPFGRGLIVKYFTSHALTDTSALKQEAESVWTRITAVALRDSVCTVVLRASQPIIGIRVFAAKTYNVSRTFSFLMHQDSTGRWRLLGSLSDPVNRCYPTSPALGAQRGTVRP